MFTNVLRWNGPRPKIGNDSVLRGPDALHRTEIVHLLNLFVFGVSSSHFMTGEHQYGTQPLKMIKFLFQWYCGDTPVAGLFISPAELLSSSGLFSQKESLLND